MKIYRFIQSKSVREHLKKINYTFSPLQMAYIIWQCPDATLNERFDAWQEIIDTMPDAPLPDNMELKEMEGVHEFLRQYIKLQQEFLDEFNGEEDGVHTATFCGQQGRISRTVRAILNGQPGISAGQRVVRPTDQYCSLFQQKAMLSQSVQ